MAHIGISRGIEFGLGQRFAGLVEALRDKRRRYGVYRETIRELAELNERDLTDLGIHRSQIRTIAMEAAYGK